MSTHLHPLRALAWKEWREQRWRFALGALVLTVVSASLVRAQLVTTSEAVAIVFGPLGVLLSIFLAMGGIPPERAAGTWNFLITQPIRGSSLLLVKWAVGAASLLAALLLAGIAAYLAAASRGMFNFPPIPEQYGLSEIHSGDTRTLLLKMVTSACVGFLAFYSLLFAAMIRARNELHAGLAGVLLTILVAAWAIQYALAGRVYEGARGTVVWCSSLLNPLSPLLFQFEQNPAWHWLAVVLSLSIWVGVPILVWVRRDRRAAI